MDSTVQWCIETYIQHIDDNNFDRFYLSLLWASKQRYIPEVTKTLLDADIHPELYLHNIPDYFLEGLYGIDTFHVPALIKAIGRSAFLDTSLKKITLSEGLTFIDNDAFTRTNLQEVSLPDSVEEVGTAVFFSCLDLHTVHLGKLPVISAYMFARCEKLELICIPSTVSLIEDHAFASSGLKKIIYNGTRRLFTAICTDDALPPNEITLICKDGTFKL